MPACTRLPTRDFGAADAAGDRRRDVGVLEVELGLLELPLRAVVDGGLRRRGRRCRAGRDRCCAMACEPISAVGAVALELGEGGIGLRRGKIGLVARRPPPRRAAGR